MISVEEAIEIIFSTEKDFGTEAVDLNRAIGRILREPLLADRNFPPYHRITMDGIAIRFEDFAGGQRTFPIAGIAAAGAPRQMLEKAGVCMEAMTGGVLPEGADTIIRYEDLIIENQLATITIEQVSKGQNVHPEGWDRKKGDEIVSRGALISPAEIGVASTIGKNTMLVSKLPRAIIISTGDELVDIQETPLPHQIRRSNVYRLQTTLHDLGIPADTFHLKDDYREILTALRKILDDYQVVLLSGGVSKGKFDFLPEALTELGVKKLFYKISQRPGKPFWFGESPHGTVIFALPGNPVSSFLCTHRYFVPWLRRCLGFPTKNQALATLATDFFFKPDLTYFLQVRLDFTPEGQILAFPVEGNGSGDLANLVDADAFLQLPKGKNDFFKGEVFPYFPFRGK